MHHLVCVVISRYNLSFIPIILLIHLILHVSHHVLSHHSYGSMPQIKVQHQPLSAWVFKL